MRSGAGPDRGARVAHGPRQDRGNRRDSQQGQHDQEGPFHTHCGLLMLIAGFRPPRLQLPIIVTCPSEEYKRCFLRKRATEEREGRYSLVFNLSLLLFSSRKERNSSAASSKRIHCS